MCCCYLQVTLVCVYCEEMVKKVKCSLRFIVLLYLCFPFFSTSEELRDVLMDAYSFYPDVEKGKTELQISEKDLSISKRDFLPSIDFSATQGRKISKSNPDTSRINDSAFNPSTFDVDLSQPLGYTKAINLKKARNDLSISKLSLYSTVQDVLFKATKAYYTVLKDYFLLDVSKRNEENLIKKLEAAEKRFEFKDVTKTDVFQAKARLAQATSKRIEAENNLEISISDFKSVVGRDPNVNWLSSDSEQIVESNPKDWSKFGELPNLPMSLEESLKTGLEKNPDYRILNLQLQNSKLDIKKNALNFAPEFSISGSMGRSLDSSRTVERTDSYSVTASVSVPIFNKGHNVLNLEKSKDSALTVIKSLDTKKLDLTFQIKSSWKKIESSKSSIESLGISVESNLMALDGVTKEASVGTRTTLEILDTQKDLADAESNLVNAQYQLIISSFELLKLCGVLNFDYLGM